MVKRLVSTCALAAAILFVVSQVSAAPAIFDQCGGIVEIQAPLNVNYPGPVLFEGRVIPPTFDLFDECKPTAMKATVTPVDPVTGVVKGLPMPIALKAPFSVQQSQWGWESVSKFSTKGCWVFSIEVEVSPACDPVTAVHSVRSKFGVLPGGCLVF